MDTTIQERIVYPIEERTVIKGYDEYEDLPDDASILVYSLNEIAAEKVVALLDPARNEPRDLYDIEYLTSSGHVNLLEVVEAVEQKWKFRGKEITDVREEFLRKEARLKKLWNIRLSSQVTTLPEFNKVYRAVFGELRRAELLK